MIAKNLTCGGKSQIEAFTVYRSDHIPSNTFPLLCDFASVSVRYIIPSEEQSPLKWLQFSTEAPVIYLV